MDIAAQLAAAEARGEARGEAIGKAKGEANVVRQVLPSVIITEKAIVAAVELLLKRGRYEDAYVLEARLGVISKLRNDLQDKATSLGLQSKYFEKRSFMGVQLQYGRSGHRREGCSAKDKDVLWPQAAANTACNGDCISDEQDEMTLDEARTLLQKTLLSLKRLSIFCFLIIGLDACGYQTQQLDFPVGHA